MARVEANKGHRVSREVTPLVCRYPAGPERSTGAFCGAFGLSGTPQNNTVSLRYVLKHNSPNSKLLGY
jgi:hypothetical protein